MTLPRVLLVGATGAVGQEFLRVLEMRRFPMASLRLSASRRSRGKRIRFMSQELSVEETTPDVFIDSDLVFISVSSTISQELVPIAVEAGAVVVDDSAAFRMESHVPLVVPEINAADLDDHKGITAIPNCSTTQMVMALYPIHKVNPIRRIVVDTYQSVSGTGRDAMDELEEQTRYGTGTGTPPPRVYPHQIAFNVLPQIDSFLEGGYTKEERKMVEETRKIMHAPDIAISATCVRVPVYISHSEAIHVELTQPMSPDEARKILMETPGVEVVDDPSAGIYPLALSAAGRDEVFVGRIRQDSSHPNGLAMWVVSDNLRKGAALNAVQIAEELVARKLLRSTR